MLGYVPSSSVSPKRDRRAAARPARGRAAARRRQGRHRIQPGGRGGPLSSARRRCARTGPRSSRSSRGRAQRRALRRAGDRGEVEYLAWTADGMLRHASLPRRARGQARGRSDRGRTEAAERPRPADRPAAAGEADASRPDVLAGCGRHQGGPRRLLFRGLVADGAPHREPAAGAGALPGRRAVRRRHVLLPEARLARHEQGDPACAATRWTTGRTRACSRWTASPG